MIMQSIVTWVLAAVAGAGLRGGESRPPLDHPAHTATVALLYEGKIHCSGVLVKEDLIVTAGHCIPPPDTDTSSLTIYFGHEQGGLPLDHSQMRPAAAWASYFHPDYEDLPELLLLKDLGWVRFTGGIPQPPQGYSQLKPIEISASPVLQPGESYAIGGFGIDEQGVNARRFGTAAFVYTPQARAVGKVAVVEAHPSLPCPADSGSGLFVRGPSAAAGGEPTWQLAGVASEIFLSGQEPFGEELVQWSSEAQCEMADRAVYVLIGDDKEWLTEDAAAYPQRVPPMEVVKVTPTPEPQSLKELCEYPNARSPIWLTATALIYGIRDQYFYGYPKSEAFCDDFEDLLERHLQSTSGELVLSLKSGLLLPSGPPVANSAITLDFSVLKLVPGLKRLVVDGDSKLLSASHIRQMELESLTLRGLAFSPNNGLKNLLTTHPVDHLDLRVTARPKLRDSAGFRPLSLSDLENIQTKQLDLTVTEVLDSELDLSAVSNVRHLTLDFSLVTPGAPVDLGALPELTSLSLNGYPGQSWQLGELPELEHLFFWGGRLEQISLDDFPSLLSLVMEGVPVQEITGDFERSPLMWLSARFGGLKELSPDFGELSNLAFLDLRGQSLSELPESFSYLSNLEFLNLSLNAFEHLPKELMNLDLEFLDLSRNRMNLAAEEELWTRRLTDFVAPESSQFRLTNFYRGHLQQKERALRQQMGDFVTLSKRALY